ncbi:MAG: citrate synthase [Euryarchaeota archaeon RBG_19FT_COMBO_69_17]|nr:MAG: citrate synthase [Euryarchaeota archaeon RBG_19FT_COMBO_69_17]
MGLAAKMDAPRIDRGLDDIYVKETSICLVDGDRGRLVYRGFDIRDLAQHSNFEETVFILVHGRLPTREEYDMLRKGLAESRAITPDLVRLLRRMPPDAPPMDVLRTAVSYMSNFDPERDDPTRTANMRKAQRLVAKFPTIVAAHHRIREGKRPLAPNPRLGIAEDFLRMVTGKRPDPLSARIMDVALILHADHSMNASAFAAIVAASTLADLYSAIVAAIATLKGPLHGGANEAALRTMLLVGKPENAERYVLDTLANRGKIFGFGHRVYRTYDPRALILREYARQLSEKRGQEDLFRIAEILQEVTVRELKAKQIYPNVDFYSGLVYHLLGLPMDLFTPIFAVSRVSGWTAHVIEYWDDNRLVRPLDYYVGPRDAVYVPLDQRS